MTKLLRPRYWCSALAVALALSAVSTPARAGTQAIPNGLADFMAGVLPPPGMYWLNYMVYVNKSKLVDQDGDKVKAVVPVGFDQNGPIGFAESDSKLKASAFVEAARFVWMTPHKIFGATYGVQAIFPFYYADMDLKFEVPATTVPDGEGTRVVPAHDFQAVNENSKGLGDIVINPIILAWHFSPNFHMGAGLDIALPTGNWNQDRPSSQLVPKNVYTFEPLVAISYWKPGGIDLSAKIMYDFHTKNPEYKATANSPQLTLQPGQEFHFDWGASWGFGGKGDDFRAGLAGFVYLQTTEDKVNGEPQEDSKSRQFSAGPAFKWWPGMGPFSVEAKAMMEFASKNTAQGYTAWVNSVLAF